jgi:hypothetical protein
MTTYEQDMQTSQTPITACTRCGRTINQVDPGARCKGDTVGEHSWWTGLRKDWFKRY